MSLASLIFYFFEAMAALSAISILFVRNVFYGALLLIVCLLCIAGIYVLAFAEFIAVTQILVYAGGILVLIIFGIMLTSRISGKPLMVTNRNWFAALLVGGFFFALLVTLFSKQEFSAGIAKTETHENMIQSIGILLMSDFILPFEIAGMLLLLALIGSAVTASFMKSKNEDVSR